MKIYNSLSKKIEPLQISRRRPVAMYSCGPTVYQLPHIGNYRTYLFVDFVKRALKKSGFSVKHVLNITDVGHIVGDQDSGEDKVERAAKEQKRTAKSIAREYERVFKQELRLLNILPADIYPRASEHVQEQIRLIKILEKKGYTYVTKDGVYFDTSKFRNYGILVPKQIQGLRAGARVYMREKKHASDFTLWQFSDTGMRSRISWRWKSPWGEGIPGWHIECSAMAMKYLGKTIDIHVGGIDHIPVHHTNEIAQSEAATGKTFSKVWLHANFLIMDSSGNKMAKSEGNAVTLKDIQIRGFDPLDFRFLTLQAHWQHPLEFSWEALSSARSARLKLYDAWKAAPKGRPGTAANAFWNCIEENLHLSKAMAAIWFHINSKSITKGDFEDIDSLLGLGLKKYGGRVDDVPNEVLLLANERQKLREEKRWKEADVIRQKLSELGWSVEDTSKSSRLHKLRTK